MRKQTTARRPPGRSRYPGFLSAVMVLGMMVACSNPGPSEADIQAAVRAQLEQTVPPSLVKPLNSEDFAGMQSGRDAVIREIQVMDIGEFQKNPNSGYWPVKVFVEGTCITTYSGVSREFSGQLEYSMYRDASGQWTVR